jgi:hypothetical protein
MHLLGLHIKIGTRFTSIRPSFFLTRSPPCRKEWPYELNNPKTVTHKMKEKLWLLNDV